jgi:hypothetical protein
MQKGEDDALFCVGPLDPAWHEAAVNPRRESSDLAGHEVQPGEFTP